MKFFADKSTITFTANGSTYTVNVPSATITYDPGISTATTAYDSVNDVWQTNIPASCGDNAFLSGVVFGVPAALPGGISNVNWSVRISHSPQR